MDEEQGRKLASMAMAMSPDELRRLSDKGLIASLRQGGIKFNVIAAGTPALAALMMVPGSSHVINGIAFFNNTDDIDNLLRGYLDPDTDEFKYVSQEAAEAYARIAAEGAPIGVGVTASVTSDYEKRSDDQAFVSLFDYDEDKMYSFHVVFNKGEADDMEWRERQISILDTLTLQGIGYLTSRDSRSVSEGYNQNMDIMVSSGWEKVGVVDTITELTDVVLT